jgi:hypothetical protein
VTDIRVATTPQLLDILYRTRELRLNRQPPATLLLDPEGLHVLSMVLWGHNMDHAPILHHRAMVMVKLTGQESPAEFLLDIDAVQWDALPVAESVG